MQRTLLWLLFLAVLIGGAFFIGKKWQEQRRNQFIPYTPELDGKFEPVPFSLENRSFVVIICGYNNSANVHRVLNSVFSQNYECCRLIYIDDASLDGSGDLASDRINQNAHIMRSTFAQNKERLGVLANWVRALETCQDDEIVILLDGEDWLAHEWVVNRLNQYYADSDLWLTYGQYREFPSYRLGKSRNYTLQEWKELRNAPFVVGDLKTFYAGLFKKIERKDLLFPASADLAIMLPMLEMAHGHVQFISEILAIVNREEHPFVNEELEAKCERIIRSLPAYQPLSSFLSQEALSA